MLLLYYYYCTQKINAKNAFGLRLIDYMQEMLSKRGEMTNFQVWYSTTTTTTTTTTTRTHTCTHAHTHLKKKILSNNPQNRFSTKF